MPVVRIEVAPRPGGGRLLVAPGLDTPHQSVLGLTVTGAPVAQAAEVSCAQHAHVIETASAPAAPVTLAYAFSDAPSHYPEALFAQRPSRFTRAAAGLVEDARSFCEAPDPARAIANHVAGLFSYGHPDTRYYEATDHIPQLCGLTQGSCIDINAYFIASLRAAGVEAGYVTGFFFPAEKTDANGNAWCEDMHCWVVTRDGFGLREWDIAHHMKAGLTKIAPGLNPKPGQRFAVAHSMGLTFPDLGLEDLKLMAEPMWVVDDRCEHAALTIRLEA